MNGWVIKEDDLFWYGDGEGLSAHGIENVSGQRVDGRCFQESGIVRNFGDRAVRLEMVYEVAADFADMFEVRGFQVESPVRSPRLSVSGNVCAFSYDAEDGRAWETRIELRVRECNTQIRWVESAGIARAVCAFTVEPGRADTPGCRLLPNKQGAPFGSPLFVGITRAARA
ncbi:glycogen debranching N-terminal domain-containing protein [Alicyclobacillus fructus]|uniref:glycogen debranching N-terminal domain-containing protein n=1 Tax=Alicyclobacillus fructus TaxID=2816082 RepID=UPI001F1B9AFD|nr:glycogen debranching N-terminal domain-containing protein [Alicyclobacillus fructus]